MKRLFLYFICVVFSLYGSAQEVQFSVINANSQELTIRAVFPDFSTQQVDVQGVLMNKILIKNAYPIADAQAPQLLKSTTSFIMPEGAQPTVEVIDADYYIVSDFELAPSRGVIYRNVNPETVPYIKGSAYLTNAYLGDNQGTLGMPYQLRDFHGCSISVSPYAYQPVEKNLKVYRSVTLRIHYNQTFLQPIAHKNNFSYDKIYTEHFINYTQERYTPLTEEGELLIIAPDNFVSALLPLKEWKIKTGIPTTIVPLSVAGSTSSAIKSYITNYYNTHNLAFVITVGDDNQFPPYYVGTGWNQYTGDNYYVEVAGGDSYPDILLGKISASNLQQVTTQVQKFLMYEQALGETAHYPVALGIASEEGTGDDNEYDYQHIDNINQRLMNYTYTSQYELFEGSHGTVDAPGDPSPALVSEAVNTGVGVINYCGHGAYNLWVSSGFSNTNIANLTNYDRLPVIFSVACVNGDYVSQTCFAETWLWATKNNRLTGAAGTIMSTINQPWDSPMCGQDEMSKVLTENNPGFTRRTFGGVAFGGLMKMLDVYNDVETYRTWLIFGDPSMMMRTAVPQVLTATHDNFIPLGLDQLTVACPVDGAKFCISSHNEILDCAIVSNGTVTLSIPSTISQTDTLFLTGTYFNYIPYTAMIQISAIEGPYVIIRDLYFTNNQGDTVNPEIGKTLKMNFVLHNMGGETSNNTSLTIFINDTYVHINETRSNTFDLPSFQQLTLTNLCEIQIPTNVTYGHYMNMNIRISDDTQNRDSIYLQRLYAPLPNVGNCTVNDSESMINANGKLDISEDAILQFDLLNEGDANSMMGTVLLESLTGNLTIIRPLNSMEIIELNNQKVVNFRVRVHDNVPANTVEHLKLTYYYGAYSVVKEFYLPISEIVSISENSDELLSIYPNPTKGVIRIENATTIQSVELYDIIGKLVYSQTVNNTAVNIDLSKLNAGVYMLKVRDVISDTIRTQKIVKY